MTGIDFHFPENARGVISLLEVETPGRRSVLAMVQRLLLGLRIQIVQVESVARGPGLVERFHIVEFDGAPIGRRRAATIRGAVRKAIRALEVAA